jgi:hypothetical protein
MDLSYLDRLVSKVALHKYRALEKKKKKNLGYVYTEEFGKEIFYYW